ncbi:MAG: hypothetical protein H6556_15360 [Lewinellaceae bacterium]|nr:hypothetical protein [Lewinellaceae bacterium]
MNWEDLPINDIRRILRIESDPQKAFQQIVESGEQKLPSNIWSEFKKMNIGRDIQEAKNWLTKNIKEFPNFSGIYLGLDTLNMDEGTGVNIEIGLSSDCNPDIFTDEWAFECDFYGEGHLIKGLYEVADCFENEGKWTDDERAFSEYLIFLGYSGIILREALRNLTTENDFLSIWGFHDGDMFFLVQKKGELESVVTEIELS